MNTHIKPRVIANHRNARLASYVLLNYIFDVRTHARTQLLKMHEVMNYICALPQKRELISLKETDPAQPLNCDTDRPHNKSTIFATRLEINSTESRHGPRIRNWESRSWLVEIKRG